MNKILVAVWVCIIGIAGTYCVVQATANCGGVMYDGEGNQIPEVAVKALVKSQYVETTPLEDSLIAHYFK